MTMVEPALELRELTVSYGTKRQRATATPVVAGVDLTLAPREILGLVGESGCGKSTLARAVVGLEPSGGALILGGASLPRNRTRSHARAIQLVFQDPYASLNPKLTVSTMLQEVLSVHRLRPASQIPARAAELVHLVGLPARTLHVRPSALSGGQRQRVAIARALALEPSVLIADEPTTALDVSVQAVILELFANLRDELGLSIVLITHNLSVVSALCDRIAVMYLGRIVEQGTTASILTDPRHPYTQQLLSAVPRLGHTRREFTVLTGDPPSNASVPPGCAFHPRCPSRTDFCAIARPELSADPHGGHGGRPPQHLAACHYAWQPTTPAVLDDIDGDP
jgi:oligopeptide/dipeptide ABC transporter ATP-binding protein